MNDDTDMGQGLTEAEMSEAVRQRRIWVGLAAIAVVAITYGLSIRDDVLVAIYVLILFLSAWRSVRIQRLVTAKPRSSVPAEPGDEEAAA